MLAPVLLWVAACGVALAPEPATPPVSSAPPCIACRAPVLDAKALFSDTDWASLESGAVLHEDLGRDASGPSPVAGQGGASLVPRPPREVWAVLTDFERWPEFMPLVNETRVERRAGATFWVAQHFSVMWYPLRHTTVYELDPADGRLSWHLDLDEPHDIASSEGSWQLVAVDDGRATVVRYQSRIGAGRAVPEFLEHRLRERSLTQMLSALRDAVQRRYPEN
jgi:coenzyme Q-binding protein COQ10